MGLTKDSDRAKSYLSEMSRGKTNILLDILSGKLNKDDLKWVRDKNKFESIIRYSKENGLYYSTIIRLQTLDVKLPHLDEKRWQNTCEQLAEAKRTVNFLMNECQKDAIDFRIIKLFDTVEHVPNDIDIFVRTSEREAILGVLKNNDMKLLESSIAETKLVGEYVKTDIYTKIRYVGLNYVSDDVILESTRTGDFQGLEYPALDYEADLLMLIPHHILGHRRITLLDFIHLRKLLEEVDLKFCRRYAYDHGWGYLFDAALVRIGRIDNTIFCDGGHVEFPHTFDRKFVYDCIRGSNGHELSYRDIPVLYMSFLIHDLIYAFEGTIVYDFVKSSDPLRNAVNWISTVLKSRRGDKTSPSE